MQQVADGGPPVSVHTYPGRTQAEAAIAFKAQAARLAANGYVPVSQSWAPGRRTAASSFWIGLAVGCLIAGFLLPPLWVIQVVGLIIGLVSGKGPAA